MWSAAVLPPLLRLLPSARCNLDTLLQPGAKVEAPDFKSGERGFPSPAKRAPPKF